MLICAHRRPDGDSIGSQLALSRLVSLCGGRYRIVNRDPVPRTFQVLPRWTDIEVMDRCPISQEEKAGSGAESPPSLLCVDTSSIDWLGFDNSAEIEPAVMFNLDHHVTNNGYGRHSLVQPEYSSSCELVYRLYKELEIEIDRDTAHCLFLGIMTDTGDFTHRHAGPSAFRAAADLMERGVDHWEFNRSVFEGRPLQWLRLMGTVVSRVKELDNGTILVARLTPDVLEQAGAQRKHAHGIINQMASVKGVEVAVTFDAFEGQVHVEMRSNGTVDVSAVALTLGGGGHHNAAGCTIDDTLLNVESIITGKIRNLLSRS